MGKKIIYWFIAGVVFLCVLGVAMIPLQETSSPMASVSSVVSPPSATAPNTPSGSKPSTAPQPATVVTTLPAAESNLAAAFSQTPAPEAVTASVASSSACNYLLNTNTQKFHIPSCFSIDLMDDANKLPYEGTRDAVVAQGYSPCMNCNP